MSKLIFTHLFLNLYLLAIIQPAIPVIEYFVHYQFIAKELCENKDNPLMACNGKCYLEKQVKKQQNLDLDQNSPMPPKVDLEKYITLKNKKFTYNLNIEEQRNHNPIFYKKFKVKNFINKLLRPPII